MITYKIISILFTTIFSAFSATGSLISQPENFCDQLKTCTSKMESITHAFKNSGIQFTKLELSAYSGECNYLNSPYNPQQTHYAAFLFESQPHQITADGVFLIHYQNNPFDEFTELDLKKEFMRRGYVLKPVFIDENSVRLSITKDFNYWFRSNESGHQLYMIAQQGGTSSNSLVFCQFNRLKNE